VVIGSTLLVALALVVTSQARTAPDLSLTASRSDVRSYVHLTTSHANQVKNVAAVPAASEAKTVATTAGPQSVTASFNTAGTQTATASGSQSSNTNLPSTLPNIPAPTPTPSPTVCEPCGGRQLNTNAPSMIACPMYCIAPTPPIPTPLPTPTPTPPQCSPCGDPLHTTDSQAHFCPEYYCVE
jgi:hypothetical protein